jgi:hypothetical protein
LIWPVVQSHSMSLLHLFGSAGQCATHWWHLPPTVAFPVSRLCV